MFHLKSDKTRWILYDCANSVFATTVVAALFPIMLKNYWAPSYMDDATSTYYLGLTNSLTAGFIFLLTPLLGYLIDHKIKRPHKVLFVLALIGALLSSSLAFVPEGSLGLSLVVFSLAFIFFAFGNTFYDSLLIAIVKSSFSDAPDKIIKQETERVSSYGYFSGYLGGGILLFLQTLFITFHKKAGLNSFTQAILISFISVGIWWILFSLPLLSIKIKKVKLEKQSSLGFIKSYKYFFSQLRPKAKWFLLAFFLYIDVVYTTYKMALDFGLSLGLSQNILIGILIYVQIIGAPGVLFIQYISKKRGIFSALLLGIFCYGTVLAFSPFVKTTLGFLLLATLIGISQGGIQSLSRAHFATLTPPELQGMSFGVMNLIGKASAILGPLIVGYTAVVMGSNTFSLASLIPLLILGGFFLFKSTPTHTSSSRL